MFIDQLKSDLHQSQPLFIGEETAFKAAVLVPLVQVDGEWHVLFEVRSLTMRKQPGDISFPGGKLDGGETAQEAALRETYEELDSARIRQGVRTAQSLYCLSILCGISICRNH